MKVLTKYFLPICALLIITITVFALFRENFFRVHDFTQGVRIVEMYRGFRDGQIPVRWSKNLGFGYGMPTFLFYAPLPYIVGAFFYWITDNVVLALKIIWALPSILSFFGMYVFSKKYFGRIGAIIAATSFTLAPYRAIDLYIRGAIGEVWAIAAFPWVLWSIDQWFANKKKIDFQYVGWTTFLFLSHNLMTMFFAPVMGAYILLKWIFDKNRKFADLVWCYVQILISAGLSAFYLLPAFLEKEFTQIESIILSGYFDYSLHFLYLRQFFKENWKYGGSTWGPEDDLSFFLGYGQLLGVLLLCTVLCLIFIQCIKKGAFKRLPSITTRNWFILFSFFGLVGSILFATQRSKFFWDHISILQTAQFPWRFLSLSLFFIALLNGGFFKFYVPNKIRYATAAIMIIVLAVPSIKYFQPEKYLEAGSTFYYVDEQRIRQEMSETWPDFLPKDFNKKLPPTDQRFHIVRQPDLEKEVEVVVDRSHQLLLRTNFNSPTLLTLHIGDFPGWRTFLNGTAVTHSISEDGLIELVVPTGPQMIGADLERTPVRNIADILSILTVCLLLGYQLKIPVQKGIHGRTHRN